MKVVPLIVILVVGYLVFVKMPFLFLKKSMEVQKKKLEEEEKSAVKKVPEVQKIRIGKKAEPKQPKQEKQEKQEKKPEIKRTPPAVSTEEVFGFKPNELILASELKKRYYSKLKENHPDRVASMGEDFKKLAEKNTKDINLAYEKLKRKAA